MSWCKDWRTFRCERQFWRKMCQLLRKNCFWLTHSKHVTKGYRAWEDQTKKKRRNGKTFIQRFTVSPLSNFKLDRFLPKSASFWSWGQMLSGRASPQMFSDRERWPRSLPPENESVLRNYMGNIQTIHVQFHTLRAEKWTSFWFYSPLLQEWGSQQKGRLKRA